MTGPSMQPRTVAPNSTITVCRLTDEYMPAWDKYVRSSPDSTVYHLPGVKKAIEETYQGKTIYLLALNSSKDALGVLPMVSLPFPWMTDALVSMPYSAYGGPLADSESVTLALLREAESIRKAMGLGSLLVKGLSRVNVDAFNAETVHYSMTLDTNRSFEAVWKSMTAACRNHCNKATRLGVRIELGHDETVLRDFYTLYVDQQHRHGSPMHSLSWYRQLRKHLPDHVIFAVAYLGAQPIASVCALVYRNRLITNNGGRSRAFSSSGANNLLQCELIRYACAGIIDVFDFARSEVGSGTFEFKQSFGARPIRTYYQYSLSPGQRPPTTEPSHPSFRLPVEVWKRLPRFLVRAVGPTIRKHLAT